MKSIKDQPVDILYCVCLFLPISDVINLRRSHSNAYHKISRSYIMDRKMQERARLVFLTISSIRDSNLLCSNRLLDMKDEEFCLRFHAEKRLSNLSWDTQCSRKFSSYQEYILNRFKGYKTWAVYQYMSEEHARQISKSLNKSLPQSKPLIKNNQYIIGFYALPLLTGTIYCIIHIEPPVIENNYFYKAIRYLIIHSFWHFSAFYIAYYCATF